jgi:hypothetical protein
LGAYLFEIKREDARRALEALYLEEGTDPHLVLEELRTLRFDLDEYIRSVEGELFAVPQPQTSKKSIGPEVSAGARNGAEPR